MRGYLCGYRSGFVPPEHMECGRCSSDLAYSVMGTKSFTLVSSSRTARGQDRQFLLAARMWDGLSLHVTSPVFQVHQDASGQEFVMEPVQHVPTQGAQRWRHITVRDPTLAQQEFVAVSNLVGASALYRWNSSSTQPVDVGSHSTFHEIGGASLQSVDFAGVTLLVLASMRSAAPCAIYQMGSVISSSHGHFQLPGAGGPTPTVFERVGLGPLAVRPSLPPFSSPCYLHEHARRAWSCSLS